MYKAIVKYESCSVVYVEAETEAEAIAACEGYDRGDLMEHTLWKESFLEPGVITVVSIEEQ